MNENNNIPKTKSFIKLSKLNYVGIAMIAIGIGIGLFFTAQWRTRSTRAIDPVISYVSLVNTKDDLVKEQTSLKEQIKNVNKEISQTKDTLKIYSSSRDKVEQLDKYEEKVGLTEMTGEGITIKLADSPKEKASSNSITHAADLRDIVNFLWGNGAKAITINGERIVFNTSIDCIVNTILINSTKTTPPFDIKAIGDKNFLYDQIMNQNFLKDIHKRVDSEGLVFNIEKSDNLNIKPYTGSLNINFAKISQ